jgi:hypothetical protein
MSYTRMGQQYYNILLYQDCVHHIHNTLKIKNKIRYVPKCNISFDQKKHCIQIYDGLVKTWSLPLKRKTMMLV